MRRFKKIDGLMAAMLGLAGFCGEATAHDWAGELNVNCQSPHPREVRFARVRVLETRADEGRWLAVVRTPLAERLELELINALTPEQLSREIIVGYRSVRGSALAFVDRVFSLAPRSLPGARVVSNRSYANVEVGIVAAFMPPSCASLGSVIVEGGDGALFSFKFASVNDPLADAAFEAMRGQYPVRAFYDDDHVLRKLEFE